MKIKKVSQSILVISILMALAVSPVYAATVDTYIADADKYIEKKDFKAAVIQLKNALQQAPDNTVARTRLGNLYLKLGDGPSAEKEFRRARKHNAKSQDWMPGLADAMLMQQKAAEVLNDFTVQSEMEAALKADIYSRRGQASLMLQNITEAETFFAKALALDANHVISLLGSARLDARAKNFKEAALKTSKAIQIEPDNILAISFDAELSRQQGNFESAKTKFEVAIKKQPNYIPALSGLSSVLIALNKTDEALVQVNKMLLIVPNHPIANYQFGLLNIQKNNIPAAEAALSKVLQVTEKHPPSLLLLGKIKYQQNNFEQAEKHLKLFHSMLPAYLPNLKLLAATRLKLKNFSGAQDVLEEAEKLKSDDADILSMLGMVYSQQGELSKGTEYFEKAAKISPEKANIKTQLGLSYLASGDLDDAVSSLEDAVKLDKDFYRADVMLVLAYLRKRDYDKALQAAKLFAQKQPDNPVAYNFQGAAYGGKQDRINARKAFNKALEINPKFSVAEINLANLDIQEDKVASAKQHYKNIISYDEKNINAYLGLAKLLLNEGDKEKSLEWVKKSQIKNPKAIEPALVLIRFYLANKNAIEAMDVAENLVSIYPNSPTALDALAKAQYVNKDIDGVIVSYEKIAKLSPNNANAHFQLAIAKLEKKKTDEAVVHLERAMDLEKNHIGALSTLAKLDITNKKYKSALARVESIKKAQPDNATGWVVQGDVYMAQKRYEKAVSSYKKAMAKNVNNNKIVFKLANAYKIADKFDESAKTLITWLKKHPSDISGHMLLAQYYQGNNMNDKAAESYETVIKMDEKNLIALNNVAWIYAEQENPKAVKYGRMAYDLASNNPAIADTYGWALVKNNKLDKGLNLLKQASVQAPNLGDIKYHVAYAYHKQGKNKEAKIELDYLLKMSANFSSRKNAEKLLSSLK